MFDLKSRDVSPDLLSPSSLSEFGKQGRRRLADQFDGPLSREYHTQGILEDHGNGCRHSARIEQFVHNAITSGMFRDEGEVIRQALHLLQQHDTGEQLRQEIQPALERLDRGEGLS